MESSRDDNVQESCRLELPFAAHHAHLGLWHKPHAEPWACPLPRNQAGLPWPTRYTKQPPAYHLPQPLRGCLGSPHPSTPLVFVAGLKPQVRGQQTQHYL